MFEDSLMLGMIGIGVIAWLFAKEFKEEGNTSLYYFFMFIASLVLPLLTSMCKIIAEDIGTSDNLVTLFTGLTAQMWTAWTLVFVISIILIFKNFLVSSYQTMTDKRKREYDE